MCQARGGSDYEAMLYVLSVTSHWPMSMASIIRFSDKNLQSETNDVFFHLPHMAGIPILATGIIAWWSV